MLKHAQAGDLVPLILVEEGAVPDPLPPGYAALMPEGPDLPVGGLVERLARGRPLHAAGCACCTPRTAVAQALNRLYLRRARGEVDLFRAVLVALPRAEVEQAFRDVLVSSRYRIAPADGPASDFIA
jgi:hypothetical protein